MSVLSLSERAARSLDGGHRQVGLCMRKFHWCLRLGLILTSAVLSSGAAHAAEPQLLSLENALRAAESHSQLLRAYDAGARAQRNRAVAAAQLPDPVLQLSLDNLPVEGDGAFRISEEPMTMQKVGVMQTYTRTAKRMARTRQFKREADVADWLNKASLAELREQTAKAWLELYYRQILLQRMQEQRREAARAVAIADVEFGGGRNQQTEVFAARLALAQLDDQLRTVEAEVANARRALERWTGLPLAEGLGPPPSIRATHWTANGIDHQLDRHPDIAVINAEERAALARAEVARQETRGDWSWSLMYGRRGEDFGDMVSLGVSIPLEWNRKNRQNRDLAAELSRVDQVRAQREEMRRIHQLEIEQVLTEWQTQLTRLDHYQDTLLPLAEERERAALAGYRGNQLPLSAVMDARQEVIAADIERVRIEAAAAELWATLEFRFPELDEIQTDLQEPAP